MSYDVLLIEVLNTWHSETRFTKTFSNKLKINKNESIVKMTYMRYYPHFRNKTKTEMGSNSAWYSLHLIHRNLPIYQGLSPVKEYWIKYQKIIIHWKKEKTHISAVSFFYFYPGFLYFSLVLSLINLSLFVKQFCFFSILILLVLG